MNYDERPLCFSCRGDALYGILSMPERPRSCAVLIVVGGPQYRAGSHRQFVLIARELAAQGYPVLRFDYRGMGDSEGQAHNFESVDDDLRAAVDQLLVAAPSVHEVVIWGLCDGASAALLYAHSDARISGLVLVNPWVRTEEGEAKAYLKHYYHARLRDTGLWEKIARGDFDYRSAMRSLWEMASRASAKAAATGSGPALPDRLHQGLSRFNGRVLVILCGNDLTAKEFSGLVNASPEWRKSFQSPRIKRFDLPDANHTFSRRDWRQHVVHRTLEWLGAP